MAKNDTDVLGPLDDVMVQAAKEKVESVQESLSNGPISSIKNIVARIVASSVVLISGNALTTLISNIVKKNRS